MSFTCWCRWVVRTEKQFDAHLEMHVKHSDYDIPDIINGTNKPHPWTFQSTKIMVFERDMGLCKVCGRKVGFNNYDCEVHHIRPKCEGGSDHPSNLILLCEDCHKLTITQGTSYGGVPTYCTLPYRKYLTAGQKTLLSLYE